MCLTQITDDHCLGTAVSLEPQKKNEELAQVVPRVQVVDGNCRICLGLLKSTSPTQATTGFCGYLNLILWGSEVTCSMSNVYDILWLKHHNKTCWIPVLLALQTTVRVPFELKSCQLWSSFCCDQLRDFYEVLIHEPFKSSTNSYTNHCQLSTDVSPSQKKHAPWLVWHDSQT